MRSETRSARGGTRAAGAATAAIGGSVLLTILIGLLGPSAMVPGLGGPAWLPPFSLEAGPGPHLAVALAAAAILLGGLGTLAALRILRHHDGADLDGTSTGTGTGIRAGGTGPGGADLGRMAGRLVMLGCAAAGVLAFLPPSGSGDHLNYAAYGRMVVLGVNPYTHGATGLPGDPVADAVEAPWREEPSVYGPVATAVQALASWVGGDSPRLTVFVLALVNAAAFVITGLIVDRFTRDDPRRRLRAALLWTANPLLLYHLVAGMHVDTLAVACMVAALLARARPAASGLLLGLGVAVKVNAGLVALGPAWELRRRPGRLAVMAGVALAVVVAGYAVAGLDSVGPVTRTSKAISHASYWKLVQGWLQALVGEGSAYRGEIQAGSLVVLAVVAWSLLRLAGRTYGELPAEVVAAALVTAYVFATPYVLPWYDGMAFGLVALVAASALDGFLVAHLLVLSLAYLPARVDVLPPDMGWLMTVVRPQVVPPVLLALTAALVCWAVLRGRAAGRARTRPVPAAPPR
ncbi:hypothetical protein FHU36_002811 [Nonomuraea muscovyensis]|uniref:DUF2029 domain-containing protein n=1 Tax=Nonomuraea muscovyensis TaxID=1124761 RepID=A0A7X0C0L5_9ACTN|nr:hypothetical protein [Nonomuraea muscovyensis]